MVTDINGETYTSDELKYLKEYIEEAESILDGKLPKNAVIFLEDNRLILVDQVYKLLEKENESK